MTKFYLLTALATAVLLICVPLTKAQSSDSGAQQLLEKVAEKYGQMAAFSVDFVYEMKQPAANLTDQLIGKAFVQGSMYRLDLGDQQISSNGKAVWSYSREISEVIITTPEPGSGFILQRLFQMHKEKYHYQIIKQERSEQIIALSPQDKNESLFKIELTIDAKSTHLRSCKLFYKDGSRHTYRVRNLRLEKEQPLPYFSFNKKAHKNVEVIDLR